MSKFNKILLYILLFKIIGILIAMVFISYDKKKEETLIEYKNE